MKTKKVIEFYISSQRVTFDPNIYKFFGIYGDYYYFECNDGKPWMINKTTGKLNYKIPDVKYNKLNPVFNIIDQMTFNQKEK